MGIITSHLMLCCVLGFARVKCFPVTASPASAIVTAGATHNMHCRYMITETPVTIVRVIWYKRPPGGVSVTVWSTDVSASGDVYTNQAVSGNRRLSGSAATFSALLTGHSLTITDVQQEDGGEYLCHVVDWRQDGSSSNSDDSSYIRLEVEDVSVPPSPTLSVFRHDESGNAVDDIVEGKATAECSSPLTTPADDVAFTIYNSTQPVLCNRADTATILLCRADVTLSRSDNRAGDWWCRATWRGQDYDSTKLSVDVKFAASRVSMVQPFPSDAVALRTRVSAECATDSANPTPVIIWRRSTVAIQHGDTYSIVTAERDGEYNAKYRTSTLSFAAAQEYRGSQFDCVIQDQPSLMSDGSSLMLKTNLQVQIHGYSGPLHVGETLSLTCITDQDGANPAFTWTFTQSGQNVVSYAQTYTTQNVQSSDAGDYTCEASTANAAGKATVTVVVQAAISPTPVPTPAPTQEAISSTAMTISVSDTASTAMSSRTSTPVQSADSATQTVSTDGDESADGATSSGAIIGGAVGGALVLIIIALIVTVLLLLRRQKRLEAALSAKGQIPMSNAAVNPSEDDCENVDDRPSPYENDPKVNQTFPAERANQPHGNHLQPNQPLAPQVNQPYKNDPEANQYLEILANQQYEDVSPENQAYETIADVVGPYEKIPRMERPAPSEYSQLTSPGRLYENQP